MYIYTGILKADSDTFFSKGSYKAALHGILQGGAIDIYIYLYIYIYMYMYIHIYLYMNHCIYRYCQGRQ